MLYMIRDPKGGEIYVSDGISACGPLHHTNIGAPLDQYNLDEPAPDWVAEMDGIVLREEG